MQRNYSDFLASYLEYTSNHEATRRIHKWSAISVIAAALERRVWLDRGYYTLYPNLYIFIVGKSGLIKKSTSTSVAVDILREISHIRVMSERVTAGSLIKQMQLSGREFPYGPKFVKQSAVYTYASELSVFLTEVWGSIIELLTTFYDCKPRDPNIPWVYQTVGKGSQNIYGPCLNILGASTPAWLKRSIPQVEREGGFCSRVLFVVENGGPDNLVAWPSLENGLEEMRAKLVSDLRQIADMTGPVMVEPNAREWFEKWYIHHMKEVMPVNSDPAMAGYMGRKGDHILKLAIVRMASLGNDLTLKVAHLEWAVAELDDVETGMRQAFEEPKANQADDLAFEIRNYIKSREALLAEEILRVFMRKAPSYEIERALKELEGMGEITEFAMLKNGLKRKAYLYGAIPKELIPSPNQPEPAA